MIRDELAEHLNALQRDECYRVDFVMKETPFEKTQKVYFVGVNGAEQGPYVRKYISSDVGYGETYERVLKVQQAGKWFIHLPRIIDCYTVGSDRVVIMEFMHGETLQDVVYRCDPSTALAIDLFPRLCDAVRELHESFDPPIIHRDLKPSNIIVSRDGLTIIDLGIARTFKDGSDTDTKNFGTKAYAPPEQFGFGQTDARSDIYALGMLLYFCLTEKTPEPKARARGFTSPLIPDAIRPVIVKATQLDPADRYETTAELKRAFMEVSAWAQPYAVPFAGERQPMNQQSGVVGQQTVGDKQSFLSRVPKSLGIAWNVLLLLTLLLFVTVAISLSINPTPGSSAAQLSIVPRFIEYISICCFIFVPCAYLVSDRRPLKRRFPFLRKSTFPKDSLLILGGFGLTILVFFLVGLVS